MKKFLSYFAVLLVGLGFGFLVFHNGAQKTPSVGGSVENTAVHFTGGLYAGTTDQWAVDTTGASSGTTYTASSYMSAATYKTATVGSSSSSPAALGSAAAGHFVIAAGATTANASTTAITANSSVSVNLEKESPIAGVTCNTTVNASSSPIQVNKIAGNGFIATIPSAPVTNPFCYNYRITN